MQQVEKNPHEIESQVKKLINLKYGTGRRHLICKAHHVGLLVSQHPNLFPSAGIIFISDEKLIVNVRLFASFVGAKISNVHKTFRNFNLKLQKCSTNVKNHYLAIFPELQEAVSAINVSLLTSHDPCFRKSSTEEELKTIPYKAKTKQKKKETKSTNNTTEINWNLNLSSDSYEGDYPNDELFDSSEDSGEDISQKLGYFC